VGGAERADGGQIVVDRGQFDVVFHWDNQDQAWTAYIPLRSRGIGTLQDLSQGQIYWILVSQDVFLSY
jgi:hypothetical protein